MANGFALEDLPRGRSEAADGGRLRLRSRCCGVVLCVACVVMEVGRAEEIDVELLPPPMDGTVEFDRDIRPILETSCLRCHGPELARSRFRLDDREVALRGGTWGVAILPGDSANSPLIHYVARLVEDFGMPPEGQGDPLTAEQVGLLRAWIDQGAEWSEVTVRQTEFSVAPVLGWISVSGNERKFREHQWRREGWFGGVSEFELWEPVDGDTEMIIRGRGLYDQGDYGIDFTLKRRDVGFVRSGFDSYRSYHDDHGGYYAPYDTAPVRLGRDLSVEFGKAWFDVGLTRPGWPELVFGYEYRYREGDRSSLDWGQYSNDPGALRGVAIYPGYKAIDEQTHVLKLDARHKVAGWDVEDNFRAEFYEIETRKVGRGQLVTDQVGTYAERYDHFQASNALKAEKQVRDWLFLSGGYLYTWLEGDGGFRQELSSVTGLFAPFLGENSDRITLDQRSHTLNANTLLGPWEGFSVSGGVQGEWMRRRGYSGLLFGNGGDRFPYATANDRSSVDEKLHVRYDRIPWTVLFAEARFQQEWIDHFERGGDGGFDDAREFVRDTDARSDRRDVGVGVTMSPWTRVSWDASYWRRYKRSEYDHVQDRSHELLPFLVSGNGYPAFIEQRTIEGDEVEARLVVRATRWLRGTLKYQLKAIDYDTVTDSAADPAAGLIYAGGGILAGNRDEHVYGVNLTLTPWRRLHVTAGFSYSDSRIVSGVTGVGPLVPYEGDVYSVLSSANYVVNDATDLRLSYAFSSGDYRQRNAPEGLPLGIRYEHHGLMVGMTRRIRRNVTASLQYGFFHYGEPTAAGVNDYTAHAVMGTMHWRLP